MKKLLLLIVLMSMTMLNESIAQACGFANIEEDGCCVSFDVRNNFNLPYEVETCNGIIQGQGGGSHTVCCEGGTFSFILTYFDPDGPACGASFSMSTVGDCDPCIPCDDLANPSFTTDVDGCNVRICDVNISAPSCFDEVTHTLDMGDGTTYGGSALFDLCPPPPPSPCEAETFTNTIGSNYPEQSATLIEAPYGGFIIGGNQRGATLLVYVDDTGNFLFSKTFDFIPGEEEFLQSLIADSDGNLVGIGFSLRASTNQKTNYAFKYNYQTNNLVWANRLQGVLPFSTYNTVVEESASGNYFIVGDNSNATSDALLVELNRTTGTLVNENSYNLAGDESFQKILVHNNRLYVAGTYTHPNGGVNKIRAGISKLDLLGNEVWSRSYLVSPNNIARTNSSDITITGNSLYGLSYGSLNSTDDTNVSFQLHRSDLNGNINWAKWYNIVNGTKEYPTSITPVDNGFLVSGHYTISGNITLAFIVMLNNNGVVQWAKNYDFTTHINENIANHLIVKDDFIYIAGHLYQNDIVFAKLDLDGNSYDDCIYVSDITVFQNRIFAPYDGLLSLNQYTQGAFVDTLTTIPFTIPVNTNLCTCEDGDGDNDGGHEFRCNGVYNVCLTSEFKDGVLVCSKESCKDIEITECKDCCECNVSEPEIIVTVTGCRVEISTEQADISCSDAIVEWCLLDDRDVLGVFGSRTVRSATFELPTDDEFYTICLKITEVNSEGEECEVTNCIQVACERGEDPRGGGRGIPPPIVQPNPVDNHLTVTYQLPESIQEVQLNLTNLQGQHVFTKHIQTDYINQQIDVSNLPKGIYFLNIMSETGILHHSKIIVQ